MIAKAGKSTNIADTLKYNSNKKKGGEIMYSHGIDPNMSCEMQARVLEALHNQRYRVKAHTIVISHGDKDSKTLTPEQEKKYLLEFLNELEKRGTDLNSTAWIVTRHGNTDNIHYHLAIMNTRLDGGRFNDKFLGKNATRAAAAVSMRWGLELASRAATAEAQEAENRPHEKPQEPLTSTTKEIAKNFYNRRAAIAAAKRRKEYEERLQAEEKQRKSEKLQNRNISDIRREEVAPRKGFRR